MTLYTIRLTRNIAFILFFIFCIYLFLPLITNQAKEVYAHDSLEEVALTASELLETTSQIVVTLYIGAKLIELVVAYLYKWIKKHDDCDDTNDDAYTTCKHDKTDHEIDEKYKCKGEDCDATKDDHCGVICPKCGTGYFTCQDDSCPNSDCPGEDEDTTTTTCNTSSYYSYNWNSWY